MYLKGVTPVPEWYWWAGGLASTLFADRLFLETVMDESEGEGGGRTGSRTGGRTGGRERGGGPDTMGMDKLALAV